MTLGQVGVYSEAVSKVQAESLKTQAMAVRAGMADEKSWKRWIRSIG